jgi:hypothetical protein
MDLQAVFTFYSGDIPQTVKNSWVKDTIFSPLSCYPNARNCFRIPTLYRYDSDNTNVSTLYSDVITRTKHEVEGGETAVGLLVPTLSKRPTRRKPVQTASSVILIPTIQHSSRHQFLSLSVPPCRNADRNCTVLSAPRRMRMHATGIQGCEIPTDTIRNHAVADLNNFRARPS